MIRERTVGDRSALRMGTRRYYSRVLRYRVGIFKERIYHGKEFDFPKGGDGTGLLQIHGGGQYADYNAPLMNAKRGYATLSIAWAGRISALIIKLLQMK